MSHNYPALHTFAVTFILSHLLTAPTHNSDSLQSQRARSVKFILESDVVRLRRTHTHMVVRSLSPLTTRYVVLLLINPLSPPPLFAKERERNFIRHETPHRYRNGGSWASPWNIWKEMKGRVRGRKVSKGETSPRQQPVYAGLSSFRCCF